MTFVGSGAMAVVRLRGPLKRLAGDRSQHAVEGDTVGELLLALEPVEHALRDPRTGRVLASVTSPFYGPKLWYTDEPAGEWEQARGVALPERGDVALERIWVIVAG